MRRIVIAVPDLFFATRIATAARHADVAVERTSIGEAEAVCRRDPPDLLIVDLDADGDPVALVRTLKSDAGGLRIVGFCRHTATATIRSAREAGADQVLPRSAFFSHLDEILGRGGIPTRTEAP